MNKRFWMAFVACWIVAQMIGFLAHGFWLDPVYKALAGIWRQGDHAHAIFGFARQGHAGGFGGAFEELMGHLQKDAGAVARVGFAATSTPMVEIAQNLQCLLDDVVRFAALDVDQKTYPARVMLKLRVVKTLFARGALPDAAAPGGSGGKPPCGGPAPGGRSAGNSGGGAPPKS